MKTRRWSRGRAATRAAVIAAVLVVAMGACGTGADNIDGQANGGPGSAVTTSVPMMAMHTAAAGEPVLTQVPGYAYGDVGAGSALQGMAKTLVASINSDAPGFVTKHSEHQVLKDGEHVLNMLLLQLDMAAAGDLQRPQFVEGILQWAVGSAFPEFSELTVAGKWVGAAHVNVNGENRVAMVWPSEDSLVLVVGASRPEAEAFVSALVNADG